MTLTVRAATPDDAPLVNEFVIELAFYEKLRHHAVPDDERLAQHLAPDFQPRLYCFIAEVDGDPVGFAFCYLRYTTFRTNPYVHLEDLFVREAARGTGAGHALFREVCKLARSAGHPLVKLEVLKWNTLAIDFYKRMTGYEDDEWVEYEFDQHSISFVLKS